MSKKRKTGITDKWGFWHTCYIAKAIVKFVIKYVGTPGDKYYDTGSSYRTYTGPVSQLRLCMCSRHNDCDMPYQ